jgi:hypothetical protein
LGGHRQEIAMTQKTSEFLALERAIAPFAEGFAVRSDNKDGLSGVYLHRVGGVKKTEIGVFAGLLVEPGTYPHLGRVDGQNAIVMAYVRPIRSPIRKRLVDEEEGIFRVAHQTLLPIASPEPFEIYETQVGALVRRRRLPEGAANLSDRRLLEFCRGSLALLGQAGLLDTMRQFVFEETAPAP